MTPGRYLQIAVRDTGHGISAADLPRIFEPFFTTKEVGKGSGLGLVAVYGAVQQHKGAITVYSEIGIGTSFRILLPMDNNSVNILHNEPGLPVYGSGRILVVDDEPVMRTTAKEMLSDLGYTVLLAENGRDGLEKYREHAEGLMGFVSKPFRLVVLSQKVNECMARLFDFVFPVRSYCGIIWLSLFF